jgi:hypothetical protein
MKSPVRESRRRTPIYRFHHPETRDEPEILFLAGMTKKRVHTRLINPLIPLKNNELHPYSKAI